MGSGCADAMLAAAHERFQYKGEVGSVRGGGAEVRSHQSDGCGALVDFEDAEDVRRCRGVAHHVQPEGGSGDGLQLRAPVQPQEARHLARLQEVEVVRAGRRRGAVSLDALQLLGPLAPRHHVQLHVLGLLLVEEHLRKQRRKAVRALQLIGRAG